MLFQEGVAIASTMCKTVHRFLSQEESSSCHSDPHCHKEQVSSGTESEYVVGITVVQVHQLHEDTFLNKMCRGACIVNTTVTTKHKVKTIILYAF